MWGEKGARHRRPVTRLFLIHQKVERARESWRSVIYPVAFLYATIAFAPPIVLIPAQSRRIPIHYPLLRDSYFMAQDRSVPINPDLYDHPDSQDDTLVIHLPRRKRRWLRAALVVFLLMVLILGAVGGVVYEDPALLSPVGGALLGAQAGVVPWNGHDPLNILVMGIDPRTNETPNSDTMMVLHVDPASRDVTMLSVPRDLFVTIPGPQNYGPYKINAAMALGYNGVSGQKGVTVQDAIATGAQYAQLTVESVLGVPINYYAVVRFSGFKSIVDTLGGVTVCVPHPLHDPNYPDDVGYGSHVLDIKAGCQRMGGTLALEYARERHATPTKEDLARIEQQQALMAGIEKELLSPAMLVRGPQLVSAVDHAVITDLPQGALLELGLLFGRAKGNHTRHVYLNVDNGSVTNGTAPQGQEAGQAVLLPNWPTINRLVHDLSTDGRVQAEHATVQVLNGQHEAGLAEAYTTILRSDSFTVVNPGNADRDTYTRDVVLVNVERPGADYTVRKLAQMFEADVIAHRMGASNAQIVVILGSDAPEGY